MTFQLESMPHAQESVLIYFHEIPWIELQARKRVQELDTEIDKLEQAIEGYAPSVSANIHNATEKLKELTKERDELMRSFPEFFDKSTNDQTLEIYTKGIFESHGQHPASISKQWAREARQITPNEGNSIIVDSSKIPLVQSLIKKRIHFLNTRIPALKEEAELHTAPNHDRTLTELDELEKEDEYIRNNFAEKFFKHPGDMDRG